MTQVHFTLNNKEVQSIIEQSVKDEVSKNILTTVFNQLMENQRQNIFKPMTMNDQKVVRVKETAIMSEILRLVWVHLN